MSFKQKNPDLTVVIPARNEASSLTELVPQIQELLTSLGLSYELIVVDENPDLGTQEVTKCNNVQLLPPHSSGYGSAIRNGLRIARGNYVVTMDADLSHPTDFLRQLWANRDSAEVVIASRYIHGGKAVMPLSRLVFSKILNLIFSRGLDLNLKDMSSGFRLYHRSKIQKLILTSNNFDIQQEILVKALAEGYHILEIPFTYEPRRHVSSFTRIIRFGQDYIKTFSRLWLLRNSINCADYDSRAYDSWVIIQRFWQRQRFIIIIDMSKGFNQITDIGCGSSRILKALPQNSIGVDISARKLRYASRYNSNLVQGSGLQIPIKDNSFLCVICSQVIEHIADEKILEELDRILKPGGILILGTPDYARWQWRVIEWFYGKILPQAYADEHVKHYTLDGLLHEFVNKRDYKLVEKRYILSGELILSLQKN